MKATTDSKKTIADFEVIDHGVDHAQYFQGCGTAFTNWNHCVTGCGESAADAFNDALEQIATDGWDVVEIESSDDGADFTSEKAEAASVETHLDGEERGEECELYYYVSIRWN